MKMPTTKLSLGLLYHVMHTARINDYLLLTGIRTKTHTYMGNVDD